MRRRLGVSPHGYIVFNARCFESGWITECARLSSVYTMERVLQLSDRRPNRRLETYRSSEEIRDTHIDTVGSGGNSAATASGPTSRCVPETGVEFRKRRVPLFGLYARGGELYARADFDVREVCSRRQTGAFSGFEIRHGAFCTSR